MGLFDGYFDPEQFGEGGGLPGRLLALQRQQGLYQPSADLDQAPPAPPAPPLLQPMPWPNLPGYGQSSSGLPAAAPNLSSQYQALANRQPRNSDNLVLADYGRPIASDASPDPLRPGSQYAQVPLGLCAAGPAGCAAGVGITAGQAILGGAAALLGGAAILNNNANSRPPAGSRPINQTDWSGDHTEIKEAVGAQPNDDVRISPTGDVWAQKPDGS